MYAISKKFRDNNNRFGHTCMVLILIIGLPVSLLSQNLNNPNKQGPIGTQVNTISGNLFIPRTDIYVPARGFDLNMTFFYNSFLSQEEHGFGKGWSFGYNIKYINDTATQGNKIIFWGDGREDTYDSVSPGRYNTPVGFFDSLSQYQPGKFLIKNREGVKYYFENGVHKHITKMEEPSGNFIQFTYSDSLLSSLTNNAGQTIRFSYNVTGRLATMTDEIAAPAIIFTYIYDVNGNLVEVKDPLGGRSRYTYLVNGPMKTIADKNNNVADLIYFPDMTVREIIGCNKRMSFSYDTSSNTTVVTDHLETGNQITKYTYDKNDQLYWIKNIKGNCCGLNESYDYDEYGNRVKMKDANGQEYTYTYDGNGNMLTATDPLGQVSTYTYTSDFNKIKTYKDPKGYLYTLSYDAHGNMTQLIMPGNNIYAATYNTTGNIITSTDPKGNVYTYNYDALGNPTNVTGPEGYTAALSFNARGNLLSYTDARGNNSSAEYDILNRLKKITDPVNNNTQLNYDAAGNMVSYKNKNNETNWRSYDASNRLVKIKGPTGNEFNYTYDGMDNLLSVKDPLGFEN
ncbi:MAG: RHS repeat protein, partial [Rhizobacter sp.]|nr:RHS repeat protein [Ferruginibacter sp.]